MDYSYRHDTRDRHDRIQRQVEAFAAVTGIMSVALMDWDYDDDTHHYPAGFITTTPTTFSGQQAEPSPLPVPQGVSEQPSLQPPVTIEVLDLHRFYGQQNIQLAMDGNHLAPALVRLGLVPTAPTHPSFAITVRTLEFYRVACNRCPRFAIRNFVRTLCDLHGFVFRPYLSVMFSTAFDVYLAMRSTVAKIVTRVVGHDTPDWRLKNTCPACMYQLVDEPDLGLDLLFTMDGNDSLKRVKRTVGKHDQETGTFAPSRERQDEREVDGDYYIPRAEVNKWTNIEAEDARLNGQPSTSCEGRWENMKPDSRKLTWGVFDETGLFLSLCEHGFVLTMADMVRSGEASKYFLATVEKLIFAFDCRLGGGYDVFCKSVKTLENSTLGETVRECGFRALIGAFHGHCHCRKCQLEYLATYTRYIGLADLENCERWFSKSNHLASCTRHESPFHRKQRIVNYARHVDDFDTFPALAKYLFDNYNQALNILKTGPRELGELLTAVKQRFPGLTITAETVPGWLEAEKEYFRSLTSEPPQDTMDIAYHQALLKLEASENSRTTIGNAWANLTSRDFRAPLSDHTYTIETKRRHANELYEAAVAAVHALEMKIPAFNPRWLPHTPERLAAAEKLALREYRHHLDKLESLVVARLLELTKMNQSQTGYQMRKHIAKALKSRCQAINTAVKRFNEAARAVGREEVDYDEVIDFAFLAEFDLLRETRADVRNQPWACPSGRKAMDLWFKMERAKEEIQRINVQGRRLATYLRDRQVHLAARETAVREREPGLAHQIKLYANVRGRADMSLRHTLQDITLLRGFTGNFSPGVRKLPPSDESMDVNMTSALNVPVQGLPPSQTIAYTPLSEEMRIAGQDDEAEEQDREDVVAFHDIFSVVDMVDALSSIA